MIRLHMWCVELALKGLASAGEGLAWSLTSGRKNVMSMRERFRPDPLAGFEKMAGFQKFYCLKIRCFQS